jgi:hypothetical protein
MRVFVTWRSCIYHVCINHDSFLRERNGLLMRPSRLKDLKSPAAAKAQPPRSNPHRNRAARVRSPPWLSTRVTKTFGFGNPGSLYAQLAGVIGGTADYAFFYYYSGWRFPKPPLHRRHFFDGTNKSLQHNQQ